MSLILDALRKMELERRAKRLDSAELRAEVLNYRGTPPSPQQSRLAVVVTAVIIVAAATGGLFYYKGSATPPATTLQPPPPTPAEPPLSPAAAPVEQLPLPPARPAQPAAVTRAPTAAKPPAASEEPVQPPAGSSFAVSGIAWQEERSLRRAVINGSLVREGAEISGAKVVEIRENLVRFSQGGKFFEISYPSAAGK